MIKYSRNQSNGTRLNSHIINEMEHERITKHDTLGNKKRGFPVIFNQPQASHFYSTIVKFFSETFQICEIIL